MADLVLCCILGHRWLRVFNVHIPDPQPGFLTVPKATEVWECQRCAEQRDDAPLPRALGLLVSLGLLVALAAIIALLGAGAAQ